MAKTLIQRIRKKVKVIDLSKVEKEIAYLEDFFSPKESYRPHKVNIERTNYTALDAKVINRGLNQSGRGDYRYLAQEGYVVGLAIHREKGNGYRRIA